MAFVQKTFDDLQKNGVYIIIIPRKMLIINESNTVCLVIPPPCFPPLKLLLLPNGLSNFDF